MTQAQNPLLVTFDTPHETAPFTDIKVEHYKPAFEKAIKEHQKEIDVLVNQRSIATFENTIEAYERSGKLLDRVAGIYYALLSAESNDEMMELSQEISPMLSEHSNNINLNEKLFARIKHVYDNRDKLKLSPEQSRLLENQYISMARSGANLVGKDREKYRELSTQLSQLTLTFGQNVLKETNQFEMLLTDKADLEGLPQSAIDAAATMAKNNGKEGYMINLSYPSYGPFMKYSSRRDLREKLYKAYNSRCLTGEYDNTQVMADIADTRRQIANLLGYNTYADYALERRMAKNSDNVYDLLNELLEVYRPVAIQEVKEIQGFAVGMENKNIELMPWDFSYYADKLKSARYDLTDEMMKPYFELEQVKKGVFGLATDLYGITFKENKEIPVYHPDVTAYEVFDKDGSFLSVFYTDFHPRAGKRSGAWMTEFKGQSIENGVNSRPHITIVMNFTPPTADTPSLLTYDEVETFLHEFGHALHGMFANTTYGSMSGTSVFRDFVELPSQVMENFLPQKEFLDKFAVHYQTGEKIPAALVEKIRGAANFNVAYACVRQLSFGLLDMAWYTQTAPVTEPVAFEIAAMAPTQVLPVVEGMLMGPQFSHIFSGGYAAGYYGYKWAEVLDADAFAAFEETSLFDQEIAMKFRTNVLEKGGTEDPMELYVRFRGQEPSINALMTRDGIKK